MTDKFTKEELVEYWNNVPEDDMIVIEFTDYRQIYTAIISKKEAELTFEYEALLQHYDSPMKSKQYTRCIWTVENDEIMIYLHQILRLSTDKLEKITIKTQTTEERMNDTIELFEKIRPLLDKGYIYSNAVMEVLNTTRRPRKKENGWYEDLIEYGETQGYPYADYSFRKNR